MLQVLWTVTIRKFLYMRYRQPKIRLTNYSLKWVYLERADKYKNNKTNGKSLAYIVLFIYAHLDMPFYIVIHVLPVTSGVLWVVPTEIKFKSTLFLINIVIQLCTEIIVNILRKIQVQIWPQIWPPQNNSSCKIW